MKESASKYGALTPLKETGNRRELRAAALWSAAMNSLDWDGGITTKNAQRIKAIKDATFGGSNSVSPPW